jgi:predicted acetyltransferase
MDMPGDESLRVIAADEGLWREYGDLVVRSYGHTVGDVTRLRPHGDARVGVRSGRVVAGGLGLLVPQFFGGQPVPSACMAAGCVAPEERGGRLTALMLAERIRPLRERGAVLSTVWTTSTGYAHRLGWAAPAPVFSWTVPTDELKRSFDGAGYEITHEDAPDPRSQRLQQDLASCWNGPWQRPPWWESWQQDVHPQLTTYRFNRPGHETEGVLSLTFDRDSDGRREVAVHDFWAATNGAAAAMFAFLGRHNSRIPSVSFQRTGLPPTAALLGQLHRAGSASARHWHPWMLRVLDLCEAVRLRGWPEWVDATIPLDVVAETGTAEEHFTLRVAGGEGQLEQGSGPGRCTLSRRQFAVWYAGGYRTATAAVLAGVAGDPRDIAELIQTTADREPRLSEYF